MVGEFRVGDVQDVLYHADAEWLGREKMKNRETNRVRERVKTPALGAEPLGVWQLPGQRLKTALLLYRLPHLVWNGHASLTSPAPGWRTRHYPSREHK